MSDFREEAEQHWEFVKRLLTPPFVVNDVNFYSEDKLKYLYVEAMVHGYKHAKEGVVTKK